MYKQDWWLIGHRAQTNQNKLIGKTTHTKQNIFLIGEKNLKIHLMMWSHLDSWDMMITWRLIVVLFFLIKPGIEASAL